MFRAISVSLNRNVGVWGRRGEEERKEIVILTECHLNTLFFYFYKNLSVCEHIAMTCLRTPANERPWSSHFINFSFLRGIQWKKYNWMFHKIHISYISFFLFFRIIIQSYSFLYFKALILNCYIKNCLVENCITLS